MHHEHCSHQWNFDRGTTWENSNYVKYYVATPTTVAQEFFKLLRPHKYRARVSVRNAAGWSNNGGWRVITTS